MREIAGRLGRSPSTISRELHRHAATRGGALECRATVALWKAERVAKRPKTARLAEHGYRALYVQGRGALRRELTACLRTGRALRVPRARTRGRGKKFVTAEVMISERPAEVADRAVPGQWEGDPILG